MNARSGPSVVALAVLATFAAACSDSGSVASEQLVADLANHVGPGVWAVNAVGCGWRTNGSAFAVDARHLVTNRHVVANDSTPTIQSKDGELRTGKVIGSAERPDIAVIEVNDDLPVTLPWAPTKALAKREPLVAIGYPAPKNVFTASPGQIVNFQGPNGTREAALANTPIDHGSSGGPGVRANASVAGVVTLMLLRDQSAERVAILFTGDAVRPAIANFIRSPRNVKSTCGLGPDYIPPVPKGYDIPEAPPTAAPVVRLPKPTATPPRVVKPAPTTDPFANYPQYTDPPPPPCPTGEAIAEIDEVTATEKPDAPGTWVVHVTGRVLNQSTQDIYIHRIDVEIRGDPPVQGRSEPDRRNVEPDGVTQWEFGDVDVHSPDDAPTKETTTVILTYRWTGEAISCPTSTQAPGS